MTKSSCRNSDRKGSRKQPTKHNGVCSLAGPEYSGSIWCTCHTWGQLNSEFLKPTPSSAIIKGRARIFHKVCALQLTQTRSCSWKHISASTWVLPGIRFDGWKPNSIRKGKVIVRITPSNSESHCTIQCSPRVLTVLIAFSSAAPR